MYKKLFFALFIFGCFIFMGCSASGGDLKNKSSVFGGDLKNKTFLIYSAGAYEDEFFREKFREKFKASFSNEDFYEIVFSDSDCARLLDTEKKSSDIVLAVAVKYKKDGGLSYRNLNGSVSYVNNNKEMLTYFASCGFMDVDVSMLSFNNGEFYISGFVKKFYETLDLPIYFKSVEAGDKIATFMRSNWNGKGKKNLSWIIFNTQKKLAEDKLNDRDSGILNDYDKVLDKAEVYISPSEREYIHEALTLFKRDLTKDYAKLLLARYDKVEKQLLEYDE